MNAMAHGLTCWKCGASLEALSLPLRRLDECKACHSELHVCRMCVEYDTRVAKHCREPTAEEVRDKTEANFCDHFKPKVGAYVAPTRAKRTRRAPRSTRCSGKNDRPRQVRCLPGLHRRMPSAAAASRYGIRRAHLVKGDDPEQHQR